MGAEARQALKFFYQNINWYAILLKSIFMHYVGLIMCFLDV